MRRVYENGMELARQMDSILHRDDDRTAEKLVAEALQPETDE